MKILLIIQAILSFIWGFSADSRGRNFTRMVKGIIAIISVVFAAVCIIVAVFQKAWISLVLVVVVTFLFFALGLKLLHKLLYDSRM